LLPPCALLPAEAFAIPLVESATEPASESAELEPAPVGAEADELPVEVPVEVDVGVDVELDLGVDVVPSLLEDLDVVLFAVVVAASEAVLLTPATRPTVVTPATAAAVQPATLVRRSNWLAVGRGACGVFIPVTLGFRASGPHHDNVKTVLRRAGNWPTSIRAGGSAG
jgi:hypothetical protein